MPSRKKAPHRAATRRDAETEFIAAPPLRPIAEEERDSRWVAAHYAELVEEHPFSWIAVRDQRVIGRGATKHEAERDASQHTGDQFHKNTHFYFLERSADWFREGGAP